jgi:hypothetical protein
MSDDSPASIYETQLVAAIFEPLARILIERARPELGEGWSIRKDGGGRLRSDHDRNGQEPRA